MSHTLWTNTPDIKTADAKHWRKWAYLGFQLPEPGPSAQNQLDGEVTLHYDVPANAPAPPPPAPRAAPRGHLEEASDFGAMQVRITDVGARAKLEALVRATPAPLVTPRPHLVQAVLVPNGDAEVVLADHTAQSAAQPTRDRAVIDPVRARQRSAFYLSAAPLLKTPLRPAVLNAAPP